VIGASVIGAGPAGGAAGGAATLTGSGFVVGATSTTTGFGLGSGFGLATCTRGAGGAFGGGGAAAPGTTNGTTSPRPIEVATEGTASATPAVARKPMDSRPSRTPMTRMMPGSGALRSWRLASGVRPGLASAYSRRDSRDVPQRRRAPSTWVRPGVGRRCQAAECAAVRGTGLMWANALRAFQVGKARTSHEGPRSWMRRSRAASAQLSWPACHLTKASASAVM
jgi:hypothetical protein